MLYVPTNQVRFLRIHGCLKFVCTKIVSGSNNFALDLVDKLYSSILTSAKTYKVSSIAVAEAA